MCGIVGFISPSPVCARYVANMADCIRHRGPDDEGYLLVGAPGSPAAAYSGPDTVSSHNSHHGVGYLPRQDIRAAKELAVSVALGHRRLSILDCSVLGHQPMCTRDGRYWIVYNGEIYNYLEIRQQLETLGYDFLSTSDTEILLAAYVEWGPTCLDLVKGMWGLAIYDTHRNEIFLARDRFGIKPLYYWMAPNGAFCFASEIKAFTVFPGWSAPINAQRSYDFLAWGLIDHTDETLFGGVYQLRPGHCMRLDVANVKADRHGRVADSTWYELRPNLFEGTFEDAAAAYKDRFAASIQMHLRADVPVGACLSGGLDSSSIVGIISQLLRQQPDAPRPMSFSACAKVKRFDERKWIEQVVDATGVDAHYVYPELGDLFKQSSAITWHQDEPFGSTSIFAQWSVLQLAAQSGIKVILDGQGADELLAGYHNFFGPKFGALLRSGHWWSLIQEMAATKRVHGYSSTRLAMLLGDALLPESVRQPLRAHFGKSSARPAWLNVEQLGATPRDPTLAPRMMAGASVRAVSLAQLTGSNLQMLLHWEDRNSMAHSIEARVPYLDHEFVEFALGLPDDFKLHGGVTKRVQRRAMTTFIPAEIRDRMDKIGFATPEEVWVREHGGVVFKDKLQRAIDASSGILNAQCQQLLTDMAAGKTPFSSVIWRMISFGEWIETFSVRCNGSAAWLPRAAPTDMSMAPYPAAPTTMSMAPQQSRLG